MKKEQIKNKAFSGVLWNCATNVGTQIVSFVIQIVLARILEPEAYGTIALITIFIAVANVFVTTGYSSALIQREEIDDVDCSTSFWMGIIFSVVLYGCLFAFAPMIAVFYDNHQLINVLRVQAITIVLGAMCSVHNALVNRALEFKKFFYINLSGIVVQGIVGITLAIQGYEVWALVYSYIANKIIITIMTWKIVKWRPKFLFSLKAFLKLFSFSSRILLFTLIDTIFSNLRSLIIGKKYSEEMLAYYNRGNQVPTLVANDAIGAINNVLFPTLSRCRGNPSAFKSTFRLSFRVMFYISLPVYLGLIAVAEPLTIILLTDKWADSILFMQLICLTLMFNPFFVRTHVYNAIGKSNISMWLSFADKFVIIGLLILSLMYGDVYVLVLSALVSNVISAVIGLFVNKKYLDYSIKEQLTDATSSVGISIVMYIVVATISLFQINNFVKLFTQVTVGVVIYIVLSVVTKNSSFKFLLSFIEQKREKRG